MVTFEDGPAIEAKLRLRRTPIFLRVAIDDAGKVDALDQIDDEPKPNEKLVVYFLDVQSVGQVHVRSANPAQGGFFQIGKYSMIYPQPPEIYLRENVWWSRYVETMAQMLHLEP